MKVNKIVSVVVIILVVIGTILLLRNLGISESNVNQDISYQDIQASDYDRITKLRNPFILDVHVPEQTHINNTDTFIPYTEISQNEDLLPQDKESEIIVYCRSGSMSKIASETLIDLGYTNVKNLVGGKKAYEKYLKEKQEVSISPTTQDLGKVTYGDIAETSFTVTNSTDKKVNLTRVTTSCGCTKAFPEKDSLEPKESAKIKVTFDPAVHKDNTDLGDLTRTIYIETDHPDFEELEVTITVNVMK